MCRTSLVVFAALSAVLVCAEGPIGGDNFGIPRAQPTIPFDKCSVAAATDSELRLNVFSWGYNNEFWVTKQSESWGQFGEWSSIGGFFAGGPTVIRNANNDIVVFGRDPNLKVWYKVLDGNHGDWTPLEGQLLSSHITATLDPQGLIHIFGRGKSDSGVWEKRQYANGTQAIWGDWEPLGATITSNVAAVVDAEGITHLFARGVDGLLWTMSQSLTEDGSLKWVGWQQSSGSVYLSSSATIVAKLNAQNLIEVVARGADKAFWHTRQTVNDERGVTWSPWKSLGGIFSSAPAVHINTDSLLTVYGRGPEKGLWYKQQAHHPVDSPSDAWSRWVPLGARFSAGVDAIADSRGYINVFGRGLDKSIWTRSQQYSNHTVGFFGPWTDMGGRFRSFAC